MSVEIYSLRGSLLLAIVLAVEVTAGHAANSEPTLTVLFQGNPGIVGDGGNVYSLT